MPACSRCHGRQPRGGRRAGVRVRGRRQQCRVDRPREGRVAGGTHEGRQPGAGVPGLRGVSRRRARRCGGRCRRDGYEQAQRHGLGHRGGLPHREGPCGRSDGGTTGRRQGTGPDREAVDGRRPGGVVADRIGLDGEHERRVRACRDRRAEGLRLQAPPQRGVGSGVLPRGHGVTGLERRGGPQRHGDRAEWGTRAVVHDPAQGERRPRRQRGGCHLGHPHADARRGGGGPGAARGRRVHDGGRTGGGGCSGGDGREHGYRGDRGARAGEPAEQAAPATPADAHAVSSRRALASRAIRRSLGNVSTSPSWLSGTQATSIASWSGSPSMVSVPPRASSR